MKNVNPTDRLNEAIIILEKKRDDELRALKQQFHDAYESIKPLNMIKNTFKELTQSPDAKDGLTSAALGIATGYVVKGLLFRATKNPLLKLAGIAVQALTTNLATKNADKIKSSGFKLFNILKSVTSKRTNPFSKREIYS